MATISSVVPRTFQKGRKPFAPSCPARTIRTLRKSLKWLLKLRALDCLHFLKEVYTSPRGANGGQLPGPRLQEILHKPGSNILEGILGMAPRHITVLSKRHGLEFLVFLQHNKKLSPRTFWGYRHSLSIPFKEAFEINFADRDLSPKLSSISLRPLKESIPNVPSITLWKHSRPQDLGTAQPPWKTLFSKPSSSSQSPRATDARS